MERVVAEATGQTRFYLVLLGAFAAVALLLAGVGIYGVMSHSVSCRIHEIGIRMALGAQSGDVLKLVVFREMVPAFVAVGVAGALALTRLMSNFLYRTQPTDPLTFVAAVLVLAGVAVAAIFLPAKRAVSVDPMAALRYE
jgi:putative ABC transport system permease protein